MYCHKCGNKLPEGAKFCPTCAEPISVTSKEVPGKKSDLNSVLRSEVVESGSESKPVIIALVLLMVICGVAWFLYSINNNSSTSSAVTNVTTATTTLYTTTTVNVRSCGSASCESLGTISPNTQVTLNDAYAPDSLPQWVQLNVSESDGSFQTGYIYSALLSSTPVTGSNTSQASTINDASQTTSGNGSTGNSQPVTSPRSPTSAISDTSGNLLPSFISLIEPNIVEINCYAADESVESSGSGVSIPLTGNTLGILIETNDHVNAGAIDAAGQSPDCYAVFPQPPDFASNESYGDYHITLAQWVYNPNTYEDAAIFTLGSSVSSQNPQTIPNIDDAYQSVGMSRGQCPDSTSVNVGDGVTVFGYPKSGNLLGISETVTTGIISGILPGPIYKTNAAIDHGNSGGLAILNKTGCSLGIPTLGVSGLTSGIGYIQSYSLADQVWTKK